MKKLQFVFGICSIVTQAHCSDITFVNSDSTTYSNESVRCTGNVLIVYHGRIISADEVAYDKNNANVRASGNVIIKDEKSNVYFCDSLYIEKNFNIGHAENIKIIASDKSRLAATSCSINHGVFELYNAIYTPCYVCSEAGEVTWQIKAEHVRFDPNSYTNYDNAVFEVLGTPAIYAPYFSHVSPTIKRKTGFLSPKITTNSNSEFSVVLPYLASASESHELILKPIITSRIGVVAWGYYGAKLSHGEFNIDTSITGTSSIKNSNSINNTELQKIKDSGYRGHIFSTGRYDFNETWRGMFDVNLISDNFYLKRFPFIRDSDRILESNAKLERFSDKNYTLIKTAMFQGETSDTAPKILPVIEHNYSENLYGGILNIDTSFMNLMFHNNRSARKTVINPSWNNKILLPFGNIIDINALVSLRILHVSEKKHSNYDSSLTVIPQLKCMWQWPLLISSAFHDMIFTPIIGTVIASNKKNIDIFEDQFSDIDDINLFEGYRSSSSYNIDTGRRIFYGAKCSGYNKGEQVYRLTIGQSHELTDVPDRLESSGLKYKYSNIVSSLDVFLSNRVTLMYLGSYSPKKRSWSKLETGLDFTHDDVSASVLWFKGKHCFYDPFAVSAPTSHEERNIQKYKGVAINIKYKFSSSLRLTVGSVFGNRYKNNDFCLIQHHIGFKYKNECSNIELLIERRNQKSGDIKPNTSVKLIVHLKNLGI